MQILGLLGMYLDAVGSICHQLLAFFQIGSGNTVVPYTFRGFVKLFVEKVASIVGNRQKPKDKQKVS